MFSLRVCRPPSGLLAHSPTNGRADLGAEVLTGGMKTGVSFGLVLFLLRFSDGKRSSMVSWGMILNRKLVEQEGVSHRN